MRGHLFIFALSVLLAGVFGADVVVRLSVKDGDSVTLHINADEIQNAADLLWMFNDEETFIAKISRETHQTSIPGNNDERFRNRLQVDQTGSLSITDVRTTDSGLYKLQISSSSGISHKRFNVTVTGVFGADEVVRLSVKEGDSVTLLINPDKIQNAADLLWMFNDEETILAKIDRETHQTSIPGNNDERFRNRLQVDQTGSLNITDVRTTDSGLYKLQISSSSGISYKRFNVTVTEPSQTSHWMITGPVLSITMVLMLMVSLIKHMRCRNMKNIRSAPKTIRDPATAAQEITTI